MDHFIKAVAYYKAVMHVPLVCILCLFGFTMNLMNMIVLCQIKLMRSVKLVLCSLAFSQVCLSVSYFVYTLLNSPFSNNTAQDSFCAISQLQKKWYLQSILISSSCNLVFHTTAIVHVVALTFLRFKIVRQADQALAPLYFRWFHVVLIHVAVVVCCVPLFFGSTVVLDQETTHNCGIALNTSNTFYTIGWHESKILMNFNIYMVALLKILACIVIVIGNGVVIILMNRYRRQNRAIRRQPNERQHHSLVDGKRVPSSSRIASLRTRRGSNLSSRRQAHAFNAAHILLAVMVFFVIVELPMGGMLLYQVINGPQYGKAKTVFYAIADLFEVLTMMYSSINFILYCAMSSEFRNRICAKRRRCPAEHTEMKLTYRTFESGIHNELESTEIQSKEPAVNKKSARADNKKALMDRS